MMNMGNIKTESDLGNLVEGKWFLNFLKNYYFRQKIDFYLTEHEGCLEDFFDFRLRRNYLTGERI